MYKRDLKYKCPFFVNNSVEGERIETKVLRAMRSEGAISDGAQTVYQERSEGVNPLCDIRTDRFDIAIEAMDNVNRSRIAQRDKKVESPTGEEAGDSAVTTNDLGIDNVNKD